MGFHKRWINKDNVIAYYNRDGMEGLKRLFSADALIIQDNIDSNKIVEYLTNDNEDGIRELVLELAGERNGDPHKLDNQDLEGTGMKWVTEKQKELEEWDEEHALDQVLNKMVEDLDEDDLDFDSKEVE